METTLFKKYMQSIEDFVFIEGKIVTYLWLCQVLKIHVNTAKQLLYAFSTKEDVKKKLLVTYVLAGELKNGKGKLLKLVIIDSRETVKHLFSKVTTDHVFSIQRSGGSFSSTDIFNSYPHFSVNQETRKFCTIQSNKAIEKREVKHITEAKNFLNNKPVKKPSLSKASEPNKEVKDDNNKKEIKNDSTMASSEPPMKQMKTSASEKDLKSKPGGIGSFFSRQAEKKSSEPPAVKEKFDKKEEKPKPGIGAFFKPGNKNDLSNKENRNKETNLKLETKQAQNGTKVKETKDENSVKHPDSAPFKDKKSKGRENKRKRKKKDGEEIGTQKKRRKRIVSALSSDSDSSENESSECEMEVEPEQPAPSPPADNDEEDMIPPTPGRKRIRKQIDKLFTDEEGFIITKKEFVYESCSDDEAKEEKTENKENNLKEVKTSVQKPAETKKEVSPNNGKKNKPSNNDKGHKQSSITSFFKRQATS